MYDPTELKAQQIGKMSESATRLSADISSELKTRDLAELNGAATQFHSDFEELLPELILEQDSSRSEDPSLLSDRMQRIVDCVSGNPNFSTLNNVLGVLEAFQEKLKEDVAPGNEPTDGVVVFDLTLSDLDAEITGESITTLLHKQSRDFRNAVARCSKEALIAENTLTSSEKDLRATMISLATLELFENLFSYGLLTLPREATHALFSDGDASKAVKYLKNDCNWDEIRQRKAKISFEVRESTLILTIEDPGQYPECEGNWEKAKASIDQQGKDFLEKQRGRGEFLSCKIFPDLYSGDATGSLRTYIGPLLSKLSAE